MDLIIISADIVSFVFLFVLLCGSLFGSKDGGQSTIWFSCCLLVGLLGTVADAVGYLTVDPSESGSGILFACMMSYILCAVEFALFTFYFFSVLKTRATLPKWAILPVLLVSVADSILCILGTVNGKMLYVEEGVVIDSDWAVYPSILLFLGILYLYYVLSSYRKALSPNQVLAFGGFLFFPILDSWITLFSPDMDFTYPIIALTFLVIYVVVQEHAVAEEILRQKVSEEDAHVDPLTRFKNRRAYEEALEAEKRGRAKGVLYCTVNHIDEIREKDGPEAVDRHVVRFADLMGENFPKAEICRISEKGFAAFLYKMSEEAMEKKVRVFKEILEQNDDMASFGFVYSEEAPLMDMVRDAQQKI